MKMLLLPALSLLMLAYERYASKIIYIDYMSLYSRHGRVTRTRLFCS